MQTINMHEAKTHLSHLVMLASQGEPFIIAKAGKPLVKVVPIEAKDLTQSQRLGFMLGECQVPDNFDTMLRDEIQALFEGQ
jgi:prevent-host-death family protein